MLRAVAAAGILASVALAGCGGSGESSTGTSGTPAAGKPVNGGTLRAAISDNPDHLDSGLSYATEGWELLEATGDGLLAFKRAEGAAGAKIVPDLATAMPTVSGDGKTYSFTMRKGVKFAPPASREVLPSDVKFAIERLYRVDSGGVGFFSGVVGADRYAKTRKGGISGIVADDQKRTISFHLTEPDGTFADYIATPFGDAVPKGTPDHDISTSAKWRSATGPYMVSEYVPKDHITLVRNPNFKQWTGERPDGHLDKVDIKIGVAPEQAVNETSSGGLDWYFGPIASDRLGEIKARYPGQVHTFARNNITYFALNTRKPPLDNVKVRQALNYAVDRGALVKLFGGQGTPTENIVPASLGAAFQKHTFYPHDMAKAQALVDASGTKGQSVAVWSHNTDPAPKAAQYLASVLNQLGYKATVKNIDESVYWDTISTQKGDPQIPFVQFDQDYPEGQDFVDVQLNGERIANVGNQVHSNIDVPALNAKIDAARKMPLGAARDAQWAQIDAAMMKDHAPWIPFMNRNLPKFVSPKLHGIVFNGTYYEMFPQMWLTR